MKTVTASTGKYFWRIGVIELCMFLMACGVHYITYESRGKNVLLSALDFLLLLSWLGIAASMVYVAQSLKKNPDMSPRLFMAVAVIYALLSGNWAISIAPMIFNGKVPLLVKAVGPLSWLMLRGWFAWMLTGSALKFVKATKSEAQSFEG